MVSRPDGLGAGRLRQQSARGSGGRNGGADVPRRGSGVAVRHFDLVNALRASGLDESVARALAPRHAFTRACHKLSEARIIRPVAEDGGAVTFQLTAEHRDGDRYCYDFEALLRRAVRDRIPTLGICLGAQLLATAHQGTVERAASGPEIGPALIAKRDAAESDPLFGPLPMLPDVLQWHQDEITELPLGAVLLAASSNYPVQAFRVGTAAWGVQFTSR